MKTMRSVIVTIGFRGNIVTIAGRKYEVEKLTKSSQRRLLAVLESVSDKDRCVELYSDFTPVAYFYFYKTVRVHLPGGDAGMFPAAYPRTGEHFTAPDFMDYNLPEYTRPCPHRTQVYLELVIKATWQFSDEDRELWLFATNRRMPKVTATPLTVKWGAI